MNITEAEKNAIIEAAIHSPHEGLKNLATRLIQPAVNLSDRDEKVKKLMGPDFTEEDLRAFQRQHGTYYYSSTTTIDPGV